MSVQPIFVHSMFRAGSTYVFSVFRRAGQYTCFYEPMHELVAWAATDADRLVLSSENGNDRGKTRALHHPALGQPYFHEVREAWPAWHAHIKPEMVYGAYFASSPEQAGEGFYRAMSLSAERQPVFCECRTTGRIGTLKRAVGGIHIALLRNPWDQWWSYRVDQYFDIANRIVLHAEPLPGYLRNLLEERRFSKAPVDTYTEAADFYALHPLDSEDSYALFFALWCNALLEAEMHADYVISIDRLSQQPDYRESLLAQLGSLGISELNFDDAHAPVAHFSPEEVQRFAEQEDFVFDLMRADGHSQETIDQMQEWRRGLEPDRQPGRPDAQLVNSRQVVTQIMSSAQKIGSVLDLAISDHKNVEASQASAINQLEFQLEKYKRGFEHRDKALARAMQVLQDQELLLNQHQATAELSELRAREIDRLSALLSSSSVRLAAIENSLSWRLTRLWRSPINMLVQLLRGSEGRADLMLSMKHFIYSRPWLVRSARRALGLYPPLLSRVERAFMTGSAKDLGRTVRNPEGLSPRAEAIHELLLARLYDDEANSLNKRVEEN